MTDEVKPIINMSRTDLMKEVADLRKKLEMQDSTPIPADADENDVAALKAELHELKAEKEGWLITTPNVLYGGVTCGVRFEQGMAFIPKGREFPNRKVNPIKETYFEKYKLSPEEKAAIRAREARSTAQIVVEELTHEFGYKAEYFDVARLSQARQVMDARSKEFDVAYEAAKSAESARKLAPGYAGG